MTPTRSYETIELTWREGVATILLSRPARLNSFNDLMHRDLQAALDEVCERPSARGLIIRGAGRAFCAGQDLQERLSQPADSPRDLGASLEDNYNPLIRRIRSFPVPVVAGVNGVAAGAGVALALACDLVVASRSASFHFGFSRIGLGPDSGASHFLPQAIGAPRALGVALLGEPVSATQAEAWGMIWSCVAEDAFDAELDALAAKLNASPTGALVAIRDAFRAASANSFEEQLALEVETQRRLGMTSNYREGIAAFAGKRAPVFGV